MACQAILAEDGEWHGAVIEEILPDGQVKVIFTEYGKAQLVDRSKLVLEKEMADYEDCGPGNCVMCERFMPLTKHHLRPRTMHSKYLKLGFTQEELNTCIDICRPCHDAVHGTRDEATLASDFFSLEKLLGLEEIQKWLKYARKQRGIKKADALSYLPRAK